VAKGKRKTIGLSEAYRGRACCAAEKKKKRGEQKTPARGKRMKELKRKGLPLLPGKKAKKHEGHGNRRTSGEKKKAIANLKTNPGGGRISGKKGVERTPFGFQKGKVRILSRGGPFWAGKKGS